MGKPENLELCVCEAGRSAAAILELKKLVEAGYGEDVVQDPFDPHQYFLRDRTTRELNAKVIPETPRRHRITTLDSLVAATKHWHPATLAGSPVQDMAPAIFVDEDDIEVILNDAYWRDERLKMVLTPSVPLLELKDLQCYQRDPKWWSFPAFVRLLTVTLAGCVRGAHVEALRSIRFKKVEDGIMTILSQNCDLERGQQQSIAIGQKDGSFPESTEVLIPLFQELRFITGDIGWHYRVACAIEINFETRQFALTPLPGEVDGAVNHCLRDIISYLTQKFAEDPAQEVIIMRGEVGS